MSHSLHACVVLVILGRTDVLVVVVLQGGLAALTSTVSFLLDGTMGHALEPNSKGDFPKVSEEH